MGGVALAYGRWWMEVIGTLLIWMVALKTAPGFKPYRNLELGTFVFFMIVESFVGLTVYRRYTQTVYGCSRS